MDERTRTFNDPDTVEVSLAGTAAVSFEVVWSRDGRDRPAPGTPGDVVLVREDSLARFLRARMPDGSVFVAEMQRDLVDPALFPASWGPNVGNAAIETMWRRRALAATADAERSHVQALGYEEHASVFVCRERGVAFRPPSPQSAKAGGLEECRSDEVLHAARLPAWTTTTHRFLFDSAESRNAATARFYTLDARAGRGATADVATFDRLARDFGQILDLAAARHPAAAGLRDSFPCIGCPEVPRCYGRPAAGSSMAPPGPPMVDKRLAPVAMMPFRAIAHREEIVDFAEHCDVLGGAPWAAFRTRHVARWVTPGLRTCREKLEQEMLGRSEAVAPIAALAEKLKLFEAVVAEVAAHHATHRHPHLALSPATVLSHRLFANPGEDYEVSLRGGLRAPVLDDLMPPPPGPAIWLVPPEAVAPFAHSDIVRAAEPRSTAPADGANVHQGGFRCGRSAPVRITVGRVWTDEAKGTSEFELDVEGLAAADVKVDPADRILVEVNAAGWQNTVLWCRRDHERAAAGALALRAFPVRLDSGKILDLRGAGTGAAMYGKAVVHRTYGAYYDLYSLGMLLLRAVLDNSQQSVERIAADVVPSAASFCRAVRDRDGRSAWEELVEVFDNLARTPPLDGFLAAKNLCFFPGERSSSQTDVPPRLWAQVLATAAACLTCGGVGFADTSRLDPDPAKFTRPIDSLLARVREIRAEIPSRRRAAALPAESPKPAAAPAADPRDVRIRELEESLKSSAARMERLSAEVAALTETKIRVERPPEPPPAPRAGDDSAWRSLTEALGVPSGATPGRDDDAVTLVRTLLVEGLETLGTLGNAVAELGGQEFAAEQRNLQRMVRQALAASATGDKDAPLRMAEAMHTLRNLKTSLGATIGILVEAHGRSTKDGSRRMLMTLGVAMQKELDLSKDQKVKLQDILQRMDTGLGELIARLYDPAFEDYLRRELMKRRVADERRPR